MKTSSLSIALCAGLGLGLTVVCAAQADTPAQPASGNQEQIASTTLKLEKAFSEQFLRGTIDREALSGDIADVVHAMPEGARPKVQEHIARTLDEAVRAAAEMTPEQRAKAVATPAAENLSSTQQGILLGWGWPGAGVGWGGIGAFGFPGMYYGGLGFNGVGWGGNWGGLGWGGLGFAPGLAGCGGWGGCGYGLGRSGWFW